jgi:catechol 2,3-dioxygenase-like lactoylglutathione lyase family enzyme
MNLNQITIPSLDLTKAVEFYQILGLELIVSSLPHYVRFQCKKGHSTFSIQQVSQLPNGDGIHVYFECEQLDDFVQELMNKGIRFEELPNDKSWLWREAKLKDPDNNQLILYFAGENRLNPPWKIK